ncbi:3-hydroxyacyl-CoA dehydrogenase [Endozoicomonas sp. OPT23]|uniref:3-hydroxyacyl-CoA dehydrogenase NAD-binding domain-containing protein n=1 Tax=Endozoicomonas sp. OPT23 TaxID=2072845 RepID=UPI00129B4B57|nr:3-hydroxyacyl-CoA dehydrogenase NAD-binding domain-containing protein [Endozoicomonas sp. OPT23]MRI33613.1 3-hydroxyacyl-CoA dehydrogenase [Endozoicomonas sp. OPT23]
MNKTITFTINPESIAVITVNNPPVNALSHSVREGLVNVLAEIAKNQQIKAVVIACAGRTFIAGADISEFGKPQQEPLLPEVIAKLQTFPKPIVAALHGSVLGGGFELALSCHFRVAIAGTKVGLPEVSLGLIPGSNGTQLLPRIVPVEQALTMMTSGKPVALKSDDKSGLVDEVVSDNVLQAAINFAQRVIAEKRTVTPIPERTVLASNLSTDYFDGWRKKLLKRARGQQAQQCIVTAVENATQLSFNEGISKEREMFVNCRESAQSRAMRHAFFAEKKASLLPDIDKSIEPEKIIRIGVIGAGTMGQGIAMCFASADFSVHMLEMTEASLQTGLQAIADRYQQSVSRGRLSTEQRQTNISLITGSCSYPDLSDCDLVIEAAFESMAVKEEIFSQLDQICKPDAILASNTSYLDINRIAAATQRPEKVLGMHFFSPANIMKLLEVVKADQTSDQTLVTAMAVGKNIGKISVAVGHCYGFVGNRMYACYGREANMLLLEGATPEQIDHAMESWGMAMGPLAVNDMSGIDIAYKARRENPNLPDDPRYFRAADLMVENGRLGRKTSAGFYKYVDGKSLNDPDVEDILTRESVRLNIIQRAISNTEIQNRLIFALINEGARILEEGVVNKASDIDVIWLNGYGFPRFRGGPMQYAKELGLGKVKQTLQGFEETMGAKYWKPAEYFLTCGTEKDFFN